MTPQENDAFKSLSTWISRLLRGGQGDSAELVTAVPSSSGEPTASERMSNGSSELTETTPPLVVLEDQRQEPAGITRGDSGVGPRRSRRRRERAQGSLARPGGRPKLDAIAEASVDPVDQVAILFQFDAQPPVNRHIGRVMIFDRLEQQ